MADDLQKALKAAIAVCRRKGYPVDDPEFGSAIGWGVFKASSGHKHNRGRTLTSYAVLLATRECESVRRQHERQGRREREAARANGTISVSGEAAPEWVYLWQILTRIRRYNGPFEEGDRNIFAFCVTHGAMSASKLGISQAKLNSVLEEIADRLGI